MRFRVGGRSKVPEANFRAEKLTVRLHWQVRRRNPKTLTLNFERQKAAYQV
jgi:hypothetical protein